MKAGDNKIYLAEGKGNYQEHCSTDDVLHNTGTKPTAGPINCIDRAPLLHELNYMPFKWFEKLAFISKHWRIYKDYHILYILLC
jgi:hypothetical protein